MDSRYTMPPAAFVQSDGVRNIWMQARQEGKSEAVRRARIINEHIAERTAEEREGQ